jgi:prolyl 4-hydroxylase
VERLLQVEGIVRVPSPHLDLFILRDFLAPEECRALIGQIDAARKPSRLFADNPNADFRTSETCNLPRDDALVRLVEDRITALLGLIPEHGEFLQGQRYATGQQFKPHHDTLRTDQPYWQHQQRFGQRTWTAMVFLNVPDQGGETFFPRADVLIPPRQGSMVTWNNLDVNGAPNPMTLHQGMPVIRGHKYIVTKWYREKPWGPQRSTRQVQDVR